MSFEASHNGIAIGIGSLSSLSSDNKNWNNSCASCMTNTKVVIVSKSSLKLNMYLILNWHCIAQCDLCKKPIVCSRKKAEYVFNLLCNIIMVGPIHNKRNKQGTRDTSKSKFTNGDNENQEGEREREREQ